MTKHYFKLMVVFLVLSAMCLFGPIMFFFGRAFFVGDTTQKATLGITFTIALILFAINLIMKSHLRSVVWVLLLGVFCVIDHYMAIVLTFAISCFLEELVFSPLFRYYRSKVRINKEIDKRIGV